MKLTLGMAVYDDFHGAYFTIHSALLHHGDVVGEVIVVDNNPDSQHGKLLKNFCGQIGTKGVKYYPMVGVKGTAITRNQIFELASNEVVVCCDPHVLFPSGGLAAVRNYFAARSDSLDLVQGPLLLDNQATVHTHFDLSTWRAEMWGTWDTDPRWQKGEPFEIPAQGLGAFAVRKQGWLGFNSLFRGFGGEEGYIHMKYRKAGRKVWCLPRFQWVHRFGRPDGVPYPLTRFDKVRNYVLGHLELGLDLAPIHDHFVKGGLISEDQWAYFRKGEYPPDPAPAKSGCRSCQTPSKRTFQEWYEKAATEPSDINEHVPTLKELAAGCDTVVEFGVRTGVSTAGLLAGKPKRLLSYDLNDSPHVRSMAPAVTETNFEFIRGDSLEVEISDCDLLFVDTKHTADQLYRELTQHAPKVRRRIAMHDTEIFGEIGEDGSPGLLPALRRFLAENPDWFTIRHDRNNHGLTVISRDPAERPPRLPSTWKMAINYGKSEIRDIAQGRKRVPLEVAQARYEVCTSNGGRCPLGLRIIDLDRCSKCGCHLWHDPDQPKDSKTGKVWRPHDSCPMGLWGNAEPEGEPSSELQEAAT